MVFGCKAMHEEDRFMNTLLGRQEMGQRKSSTGGGGSVLIHYQIIITNSEANLFHIIYIPNFARIQTNKGSHSKLCYRRLLFISRRHKYEK